MSRTKMFTVDKFLGLNEAPDGATELKLGEASRTENFYITDGYNLKIRPGTRQVADVQYQLGNATISAIWAGAIGNHECLILAYFSEGCYLLGVYEKVGDSFKEILCPMLNDLPIASRVKLFSMNDGVYALVDQGFTATEGAMRIFQNADGDLAVSQYGNVYIPLILTGGSPEGGGTILEPVNIITRECYLEYSADGQSKVFALPSDVWQVTSAMVDQVEAPGKYDPDTHTFTFAGATQKGVNNVRFRASLNDDLTAGAFRKFMSMRHCEAYNGATDTRLFFYGDGTNICYYTGAPAYGRGLYIPAGNEIAVDSSASAITGMVRHYSRLMAFKPDGAYTINYEPVTLEDGSVIAGFYVRPASRAIGNDMDGQIQTVENYPRTLCAGNLYEWRNSASYYPDERYAKLVSQKVSRTLASAAPGKIVTCDDDASGTYYMFLNDDAGTVLVNHYRLDAWSVYTGEVFKNVLFAVSARGDVLFANDRAVFKFDPQSAYDAPVIANGESTPISALWESGYMAFGADYKRKYSSHIWLSMLPEAGSSMDITVSTDRREDYLVKNAGLPLFGFHALDFSAFSFIISRVPKIQRIQMKVKKFVYYKLIFRVNHPGARATVLGYDQQIRYSSNVK